MKLNVVIQIGIEQNSFGIEQSGIDCIDWNGYRIVQNVYWLMEIVVGTAIQYINSQSTVCECINVQINSKSNKLLKLYLLPRLKGACLGQHDAERPIIFIKCLEQQYDKRHQCSLSSLIIIKITLSPVNWYDQLFVKALYNRPSNTTHPN